MDSRAEPHVPPYAIPPIARPVLTFPPIARAAHLQLAAAEMVRRTVGIGSMPFRSFVIPVLCIAYAWETVEHYLEADSWPMVMHWMQGVEFWGNRLIADPLALLTGALIQRAWGTPASARAVRVCTAIWLLVHLFVFANSMVLQRELATFGTVFGDKAVSWLDVWTLDHFMSGMSIGAWLSARRELLAWEPSSSTLRHGGAPRSTRRRFLIRRPSPSAATGTSLPNSARARSRWRRFSTGPSRRTSRCSSLRSRTWPAATTCASASSPRRARSASWIRGARWVPSRATPRRPRTRSIRMAPDRPRPSRLATRTSRRVRSAVPPCCGGSIVRGPRSTSLGRSSAQASVPRDRSTSRATRRHSCATRRTTSSSSR